MNRDPRPERPRDDRGRSSWARRTNDETGEWLAALARVATVFYAVSASLSLVCFLWDLEWRWAATAALTATWAGGCYWLGFVHLANPEWKDKPDGETD